MIRFVCWKWDAGIHKLKRIKFGPQHVNVLYNMLKRNLQEEFELICITDDPRGLYPQIKTIKIWKNYEELGKCFRRLKVFSEHMREIIGEDFFSIDLDVVITGDITSLINDTRRDCDFRIWSDTHPRTPYNGSMFYMKAGARKQVWETFNPSRMGEGREKFGYVGSDQAFIGVCLGENESTWTRKDGVYSYRVHHKEPRHFELYDNEKIVFFHGSSDPSKPETQRQASWIGRHWK